jgi:glutamate:GABA antiporter
MTAQTSAKPSNKGFTKALKKLDMTLFTVCAILVIDTLAASASIGSSSIAWWIITLILFFIPYGLITAELGSTYPEEGGLYIWIRRAFGEKWAARSTWFYWINVALWMPSVYILFAGMFSQMFFPDMGLWTQILIGVIMTWITVWIGTISLSSSKWVPNIGAFFKVIIMLVIGVGGVAFAMRNGVANDLSFKSILPTWDAGLAFLPVIVYNFMGFELMSGAGDEMHNPGKDIPIAIVTAGILIAFFYLFATTGMLMAVPLDQLGLVSGIIDTLKAILGDTGVGGVLVTILGIGGLYTLLANMVTWTLGANRTAAEAAGEGELPEIFGRMHPVHKTPVGAYIITGAISTLVIVLYGLISQSNADLFWTLFKFSSIIFLLPYLLLFPAFLKLRHIDADIKRPYKVPGGKTFGIILAVICEIFILQSVIFFIWVPGQENPDMLPVLIGTAITVIIGEILLVMSGKKSKAAETVEG